MSKTNLLDRFGIKVDNISNYIILGIDPGAGEWSGSKVNMLGNEITGVEDLHVLNGRDVQKDGSLLYYGMRAKEWIIGRVAGNIAENEEAVKGFYENFKVLPGSSAAMECYGHDPDAPTFEDLMVRHFQIIMKQLIVEVDNGLKEKKLIIFVGRPANKGWEEAELAYRDRIYEALGEIGGVNKNDVQIAMVSEAQASLAAEIYGKGLTLKSKDKKYTHLVIDVGSSTVDAIVVKDGKLIGEYSRQIGAGSIEGNMLELFLYDDCNPEGVETDNLKEFFSQDRDYQRIVSVKKELREKLKKAPYIRVDNFDEFQFSRIRKFYMEIEGATPLKRYALRDKKEKCFGENGENGKNNELAEIIIKEKSVILKINQELLEKVIWRMPIFVPCTEPMQPYHKYKGSYIYRSYYDALAHFMDGVKEMYLAGDEDLNVILTGGASVMPMVGQLIKQKFGVVPTNSNQPSYTVSRGLAHIGYAEIKKQEEFKEINQLIAEKFKEKKSSLSYKIRVAFSEWCVREDMNNFKDWVDSGQGSLRDAICKNVKYDSNDLEEIKLVREWWTAEVKPAIVREIKERFETLYKSSNIQYDFIINPQIVDDAYKAPTTTAITYNWSDMVGFFSGIFLDPNKTDYNLDKRKKYYQKAIERKDSLKANVRDQLSVIALGDRHADEILKGFEEELRKDVTTYVEGLTPYIVRQ